MYACHARATATPATKSGFALLCWASTRSSVDEGVDLARIEAFVDRTTEAGAHLDCRHRGPGLDHGVALGPGRLGGQEEQTDGGVAAEPAHGRRRRLPDRRGAAGGTGGQLEQLLGYGPAPDPLEVLGHEPGQTGQLGVPDLLRGLDGGNQVGPIARSSRGRGAERPVDEPGESGAGFAGRLQSLGGVGPHQIELAVAVPDPGYQARFDEPGEAGRHRPGRPWRRHRLSHFQAERPSQDRTMRYMRLLGWGEQVIAPPQQRPGAAVTMGGPPATEQFQGIVEPNY